MAGNCISLGSRWSGRKIIRTSGITASELRFLMVRRVETKLPVKKSDKPAAFTFIQYMQHIEQSMGLPKAGLIICFAVFGLLLPYSGVKAQPVLGAENIALGSGGTAYLSGFESTFLNPANLAIPSHEGRLHIGIGHLGLSYEPILSTASASDQFSNFRRSLSPYTPGDNVITDTQRNELLDEHYPGNRNVSRHLNRADLILGGFLWQNRDEAYSFVIRTRIGSRIEIGRGWYSYGYQNRDGTRIRDFTLTQQKQQLYEFSFGYGREFTIINGLIPRLSKLYVGIAPKFVISGMYHDLQFNAGYRETGEGDIIYNSDFSYHATGDFSRLTSRYLRGADPANSIGEILDRAPLSPAGGYGIGFDFGFTYLIPLGSGLPTEQPGRERSEVTRSLRIAFSLTDIGILHYSDQPIRLSSSADSLQLPTQDVTGTMFTGAGGQYLFLFDEASSLPNPFRNSDIQTGPGFEGVLPTSANAGMLFELNRLKLMADLTLGLYNTAFTTTKLTAHLGLEIRPHRQIPLRFGTRLAAGTPINFGFGTGLESRYFDVTVGAQILMRSRTLTSEFAGGAFAGLQLHF